jgi:SAM-dependent methyltransferase
VLNPAGADAVASGAAAKLSPRRRRILERMEAHAAARQDLTWKNRFFYVSDDAYLRFVIPQGSRVLVLGCGNGRLLDALAPSYGVGVELSTAVVERARAAYPKYTFVVGDLDNLSSVPVPAEQPFDFVVMPDAIGLLDDVQRTLEQIHRFFGENTRLVVSYYSHFWEPMIWLAERLSLKLRQPEVNYLSSINIANLLKLAGFEQVKEEWRILSPYRVLGAGIFVNRYIATLPLVRRLCLRRYFIARSMRRPPSRALSATVVVPCRNERGNIEAAIRRLPRFCERIEVVFVEGNSSDGTFAECERVRDHYAGEWDIKVVKQSGRGKGDAVRTGFSMASGDVLMILDADLTTPPEELPKFYEAIVADKGEFINGSRLVYPREKGAMRFLNAIANRFFAAIFSFLLNERLTDTLCGTKALTRAGYRRIAADRAYFGEFDPFGDFDLIFGAAKQSMAFVEIPVHYYSRTYGSTQISRFSDGWLLLKMVVIAWRRLKAI